MFCPDCGVLPGKWHVTGCEWEQCPYCGEHLEDCDCGEAGLPPLDDRIPWSGACAWLQACLDFGFFERPVRGRWEPCGPDDLGSQPDVSRLMRECCWNRQEKCFESRKVLSERRRP